MTPVEHYYQAIYADPPWKFLTYSHKGRSAEAHYDCMSLDRKSVV